MQRFFCSLLIGRIAREKWTRQSRWRWYTWPSCQREVNLLEQMAMVHVTQLPGRSVLVRANGDGTHDPVAREKLTCQRKWRWYTWPCCQGEVNLSEQIEMVRMTLLSGRSQNLVIINRICKIIVRTKSGYDNTASLILHSICVECLYLASMIRNIYEWYPLLL